MIDFTKYAIRPSEILLPDERTDYAKWAVIACDQFTSQPEYWEETRRIVGGAPSTLSLVYPECYLSEGESRIPAIHAAMREALSNTLTRRVNGFVLVCRHTCAGDRLGLVAALDLEAYSFERGDAPLVRPTEGTILERIPPRVKIRRGAALESPHILVLADDPDCTLIEPLYESCESLRPLYDFDLMQQGGHISGWAVEDEARFAQLADALEKLYRSCDGMLFAVGDGNHSLATARARWLEIKAELPEDQWADCPARWALVEICNLHSPAMAFEPIHRAVFGADAAQLAHDFVLYCRGRGVSVIACAPEQVQMTLLDAPVRLENARGVLPVAVLQEFLDGWLAEHPQTSVDYIHGADALEELSKRGACCIALRAMDKFSLFPGVRSGGPLPRKAFSLGEARDKRYYLECRSLL